MINEYASLAIVAAVIGVCYIVRMVCRTIQIKHHGYPPAELEAARQDGRTSRVFWGKEAD